MKSLLKFAAIFLPILAQAEEPLTGIGWQKTAWADKIANAYDFFAPENWDNGVVNGLFGVGLGTAKTTQYIKLGADYDGQLSFSHANEASLMFVADGTKDVTWQVPGDVSFDAPATKGTIMFGLPDANRKFFIDLGGKTRKFTMKGTGGYHFNNAFLNGDLEVFASPVMCLRGPEGSVASNMSFSGGKLQFDSSADTWTGATRVQNLTFSGADLELKGERSDTVDVIDGTLSIANNSGCLKMISVIAHQTYQKSSVLRVKKLEIETGAFAAFRGTGLGQQAPGEFGANILVDEAPALAGGVIPNAVANATYGVNSIVGYSYETSLATYDGERGIRPLDLATEYVTDLEAVTGGENLLVPHATTVTVSGEKTVNAVLMQGGDLAVATTLAKADESSRLKVASGQFVVGYGRNKNPVIDVPVDFGDRHGCISYSAGKVTEWKSPICGTAGVTFAWFTDQTSYLAGITLTQTSEYTGDTYVNGSMTIGVAASVFPCGTRTGDVYLRGEVRFNGNSNGKLVTQTLNGLNGSGSLASDGKYRNVKVQLGDNDANGDFTGGITGFNYLEKLGVGTQRLAGTVSCNNTFDITSGTVVLDGSVEQGAVNVAAGVAIGGSGIIKTSVAFADGAKLLAKVEGKTLAAPLTVAAASGTAIVEADGLWKGEACVLKAAEGKTLEGLTFKRGANVGKLTLSADKTELYATPKAKGFSIVVM